MGWESSDVVRSDLGLQKSDLIMSNTLACLQLRRLLIQPKARTSQTHPGVVGSPELKDRDHPKPDTVDCETVHISNRPSHRNQVPSGLHMRPIPSQSKLVYPRVLGKVYSYSTKRKSGFTMKIPTGSAYLASQEDKM